MRQKVEGQGGDERKKTREWSKKDALSSKMYL